jgi:hypothetical protein
MLLVMVAKGDDGERNAKGARGGAAQQASEDTGYGLPAAAMKRAAVVLKAEEKSQSRRGEARAS